MEIETDENPRYNRFSLPTKFVSYIAAGLPIIALGHPESTVIKMMAQYPVGLGISGNGFGKCERQARGWVCPKNNSKISYREEIRRCALAEFDAGRMRAVLYDNFRKGASQGSAGKGGS